MKRNILVTHDANEKRVAIVENNQLEEYYIDRPDDFHMFGNIYKGIVKAVIPGMGAAFVNLGTQKDGFLYVGDALESPLDLDADFDDNDQEGNKEGESEGEKGQDNKGNNRNNRFRNNRRGNRHKNQRRKRPNIQDVLKEGQELIVQVVKEPLGTKGPRLTTHFSIAARYLVMMPGQEKIGISKRIGDRKERDRIRQILKDAEIPKGVGFIVRTAAEGKSEIEFKRDIKYLIRLWKKIHSSISRKKAPALIYQELGLFERTIRDHLQDDNDQIIVDQKSTERQVRKFINLYMPGSKIPIDVRLGEALFETFNVQKDIARTFQRVVPLKSGGHLVIEPTESLVAIDVNTGKFTGKNNLEETVFKTNCEAAWEVARQLRLRDSGGIIIIDFIDMERYDHRRQLYRTFCDALKKDRAKTNVLRVSELGLIQMTRQRIRPSLQNAVYDSCPYCKGRGIVKSPTTMAIQTVREIKKTLEQARGRIVNATVHPDVREKILSQERKTIQYIERSRRSRIFIEGDFGMHVEDINITLVK